jgi:uncharacterized protein with NAD-binding domain and iron-sulfur cluster
MADGKVKIAILGGGMGAMSAALALTEIDPKGETYEITVHQLGWRLGGKTASGRNPAYGQRIEEHGLHIWSGAYDNAFTLMRLAFKALNRPPSDPLATIGDAFKRQNQFFLTSDENDTWSPWSFWFDPDADPNLFPGADSLWGNDPVMPSIDTLIRRMLAWIARLIGQHQGLVPSAGPQAAAVPGISDLPPHVRSLIAALSSGAPAVGATELLCAARRAAELLENGDPLVPELNWADVADMLRCTLYLVFAAYAASQGKPERKIFEQGVVGILIAIGAIDNDCINQGFHTLDAFDFREFLLQSSPALLKDEIQKFLSGTVLLRALYDYCFAYEVGERTKPGLSACTAVQSLLRLGLTYKGAFFFKATAGFGDTIFTPIYQLLKSRGVTFRFFHNVTALLPSADGSMIETIVIEQQAGLAPGVPEYDPFGPPVAGIHSWPNTPLWNQILNGEKLRAAGVNFEDYYSPQPPAVATLRLQQGLDFHQVILGIPVGALGTICKALVDQRQSWADMVSNLGTVRTEALQFWVDCAVQNLGGPFVAPQTPPEALGPIATGYVPPFDTYSDMSQLLPAENWPSPQPLSVAYFCGVMADSAAPNDARLATERARQDGLVWTTSQLQALWSNAGKGANFQWDLLHVVRPATGQDRFDQQFWRANISPSERYVLSLPKTLQYRLEPGGSGYANLFLAGDWTKVPEVNVGAVEVAAMSGLAAASALSGVKIPIVYANTLYGPLAARAADVARETHQP